MSQKMSLGSLLLSLLYVLSSTLPAFAKAETSALKAAQNSVEMIHSLWMENKEMTGATGAPFKQMRQFHRVFQAYNQTYSVGQFTYVVFAKEGKTPEQMLKLLEISLDLKSPLKRQVGSAHVMEAFQPKLNRYMKIFLSEKAGDFRYSIATYRASYGPNLDYESEFLSRTLHQVDIKAQNFWQKLYVSLPKLINDARAIDCSYCQGNPICIQLCEQAGSGGNPFGDMSQIDANLKILNGHLGDFKLQWGQTNAQWGTSNENWAESNKQWGATNEELKKANETAKGFLEEVGKTREMMDKQLTDANNTAKGFLGEYKRTNDLMEKMSDPKNAFMLAGATAAGAVLGATAMNMAISGIVQAAGFLKKWISGDLKKAKEDEIMKAFVESRKVYEASMDNAKKLEGSIDQILLLYERSRQMKMSNPDLLNNIAKNSEDTKSKIRVMEKKLDLYNDEIIEKDYTPENCPGIYQRKEGLSMKISNDKTWLTTMQSIGAYLDKGPARDQMCNQLRDAFRKLAEAEGILQAVRPQMMKAELVVNKRLAEQQEDTFDTLKQIRKARNARKIANKQVDHMEIMKEKFEDDVFYMGQGIENDCKKFLRGLDDSKMSRQDRKIFCTEIIFSEKFVEKPEEYLKDKFPHFGKGEYDILNQHKLFFRVAQKQAFEKEHGIFGDWYVNIQKHKQFSKDVNPMLRMDPEITELQIESTNALMEEIKKEQSLLFTKRLKDRQGSIEEICAGTNFIPPTAPTTKELAAPVK